MISLNWYTLVPCVHTVHTSDAESWFVWPKEMHPLLMRDTPCQFHAAACTIKQDCMASHIISEQIKSPCTHS